MLLISTDPAHNLSDAFQQKLASRPTLVNGFDNLFAMEIDPKQRGGFGNDDDDDVSGGGGVDALGGGNDMLGGLGEMANAIPGVDEAVSFAEMLRQVHSLDYETVVFDTAPTGHTLRLLNLPSVMEKGLEKILGFRSGFGGIMTQMAALLGLGGSGGSDPLSALIGGDGGDALFAKLESLKSAVEDVNGQFRDPALTTFVCVCIPDFLSLYETERLVQELATYEIDASNIVINQIVYPEQVQGNRLLASRVRMQQKYLAQFDELYEEDFALVKVRWRWRTERSELAVEQWPHAHFGDCVRHKSIRRDERLLVLWVSSCRSATPDMCLSALLTHAMPRTHTRQVPLLDREVRGKEDLENYARFLTAPPTKEQLVLIAEGKPW